MNSETANQNTSLECPYKGLIPYGEKDAPIFFGREDWCQIIINNLLASHFTLLYGASGVGKSSVLYAGVANRLKQQARQSLQAGGVPEWAVIVCRDWRDDPLVTLCMRISEAIEDLIGEPLVVESVSGAGLATLLQAASEAIGRVHDDGSRTPGKLLLILDQFEEYFLYHPEDSGAGSFAVEFPAAVNDSRLSLNVLISLREDSLAKLDRFKQQLPNLFANRLQIDHLDRTAAIDAIRKPIEEFNRKLPPDSHKASVEPALIQDVLDQVKVGQIQTSEADVSADQPAHPHPAESEALRVETPFLQLVMTRLWEEESRLQSPPRLRQDTLQRLGGAGTIVREHLERLMAGLPESSKRVAAIIFDKLVTSGLTKIAYPVFELTDPTKVDRPQDLVNRTELEHLLEHLSSGSQRILRPLPPALDQPKEHKRYEIFHDVLAKPILEWRRGYWERAEREEVRQRYAQELSLERQRRIRNFRISAGIGIPLLAATIFLYWRTTQLTAKERELTVIESAQQFKGQQRDQIDALVQAMWAAYQLQDSGAAKTPGMATNAGADLRHILDNITEVTKVDLLNAQDASPRLIRFDPDGMHVGIVFQNNQFVLRGLKGKPFNSPGVSERPSAAGKGGGETVSSFVFARKPGRWATVSSTGEIRIWDGEAKSPSHSIRMAGLDKSPPIRLRNRLHFSPDGERLAVIDQEMDTTGRQKGVLRILDLSAPPSKFTADRLGEASAPATPSLALVRFSPKGDLLAATTDKGEILLFNALTGRRLPSPTRDERALWIFSLEFSNNGQTMAASSPNGVRVWQRDTQGRWNASLLPALNTSQLRFSPDGTLLAAGSLDGWARVWDVRHLENPKPLAAFLNQAPVQDVRFRPDGRSLLTVSTAGLLHQWALPTPPKLEGPARRDPLTAAAFGPDGRWLAQATLGERSVCLRPLSGGTGSPAVKVPFQAGGCSGTPLPLTSAAQPAAAGPSIAISQLGFNRQATAVAALPWRGEGIVWDPQGRRLQTLRIPAPKANKDSEAKQKTTPLSGPFSAISFHPDGQRFAVVARGGEPSQLLLCPAQRERSPGNELCTSLVLQFPEPSRMTRLLTTIRSLLSTAGFKMVAGESNPIRPSVTSVQFLPGPGFRVLLSLDDGRICSGTKDVSAHHVRLLHCENDVKRQGNWWQLSASSDGSTIGLAGFDGTLELFQRGSGDRLRKLLTQPIKASAGPLSTVSFSPNGRFVAIVALDGTASLWDATGRQLASFSAEASGGVGYMNAAFASDGAKLKLVTRQGDLVERDVEDLPALLKRGCRTLRPFLVNPATHADIKKKLSFCP